MSFSVPMMCVESNNGVTELLLACILYQLLLLHGTTQLNRSILLANGAFC